MSGFFCSKWSQESVLGNRQVLNFSVPQCTHLYMGLLQGFTQSEKQKCLTPLNTQRALSTHFMISAATDSFRALSYLVKLLAFTVDLWRRKWWPSSPLRLHRDLWARTLHPSLLSPLPPQNPRDAWVPAESWPVLHCQVGSGSTIWCGDEQHRYGQVRSGKFVDERRFLFLTLVLFVVTPMFSMSFGIMVTFTLSSLSSLLVCGSDPASNLFPRGALLANQAGSSYPPFHKLWLGKIWGN